MTTAPVEPATDPVGLHRRPLTPTEVTAVLAAVAHGDTSTLPDPFPRTASWLIIDLADGRITGRRTDGPLLRSDQVFPDDSPAAPTPTDTERLHQLRLFTTTSEIIIAGGAAPTGWWHTATPTPPDQPTSPRHRKFLIGPRRAETTMRDGFTRVHDTATGDLLILPMIWQPPAHTDQVTTGSWLHLCEHFTQHHTGAVGVTHTRYTDLTTDPWEM